MARSGAGAHAARRHRRSGTAPDAGADPGCAYRTTGAGRYHRRIRARARAGRPHRRRRRRGARCSDAAGPQDLPFGAEALLRVGGVPAHADELDGDLLAEFTVGALGQPDSAHAAATDLVHEPERAERQAARRTAGNGVDTSESPATTFGARASSAVSPWAAVSAASSSSTSACSAVSPARTVRQLRVALGLRQIDHAFEHVAHAAPALRIHRLLPSTQGARATLAQHRHVCSLPRRHRPSPTVRLHFTYGKPPRWINPARNAPAPKPSAAPAEPRATPPAAPKSCGGRLPDRQRPCRLRAGEAPGKRRAALCSFSLGNAMGRCSRGTEGQIQLTWPTGRSLHRRLRR